MTTTDPDTGIGSPPMNLDELRAAAHSFVPELRDRAQEFDDLRQLPQDIAERMAVAGLYRICAPVGAGGLGLGARGLCEAVEILATGCGSAAWCAFIASTSHLNMAGATESFRARVGHDPALVVAGVFSPSGTARAEARDGADGYVVNGHWRWGSGSHNAHWISGALTEVDGDDTPIESSTISRVWLHPDEIEILDNWHVTGLRGTGSSDFVARDLWVPAERAITSAQHSPFADDPIYRFPSYGLLAVSTGAIAVGMAQASLDEIAHVARSKTPNGSRRTLATRPLVHFQFAEAQTKLRAARALLYTTIDDVTARTEGQAPTVEDRVAVRTANCHAVHTSTEVIDQAFSIAGGTSVFESSPLQRHRRDVHVAGQHMMTADSVMELAGRVMLGMDEAGAGL